MRKRQMPKFCHLISYIPMRNTSRSGHRGKCREELADMTPVVCQACEWLGMSNHLNSVVEKFASLEWIRIPVGLTSLTDEALLLHVRDGCLDAMGLLFDRHHAFV